jgi:ATP-dependent RNA helicase DeaD
VIVAHPIESAGLGEAIANAAREAGYESLTSLQEAALPLLLRGGNVVLHASSGAGVTGAWALPLLDRLAGGDGDEGGPAAVVLTPTPDRAESLATALATLSGDTGLAVRTTGPGWRSADADVLVLSSDRALGEVQASALKLEAVQVVVITELADQFRLGHGDALNTLASLFPKDAQRIVTSAELEGDTQRWVEAHLRRAMTVPARPADPAQQPAQESAGQIGYIVVDEAGKPELVARLLEGVEGDVTVYARTAERAARIQAELARRGVGDSVRAEAFAVGGGGSERTLSYDVPFSADALRQLHAGGGTVMVTPAELPHFRRIAAEAPLTTKQRRAKSFEPDELETFRQTVRQAVGAEDLSAQLLVLEPLFDEHSPAEVAAALSALLRRRAPAPGAAPAPAVPSAAPKEALSGGFARLFVSIGSRDNVRPGDIVGAITGEAGIRGDQVGRVDIRDTFSVVEVVAAAAERVIRALNGTTMRGRSLRVDFDRKSGSEGGPRGGGGRGEGPRGPRSGPRGDGPRSPRGDGPRSPRGDGPRSGPRGDGPRGGGGKRGAPPGGSRPPRRGSER